MDEGRARYREDPGGSGQGTARPSSAQPQTTWPEPPQPTRPEPLGYQQDVNARNAPLAQAQQTQSLSKTYRPQASGAEQDHGHASNTVKRGWLRRLLRRDRHREQRQHGGEATRNRPTRELAEAPSRRHDWPQRHGGEATSNRPTGELAEAPSRRHDWPQRDAGEAKSDRPFTDVDEPESWPQFVGKENRISVLDIARKILRRALKEVARFRETLRHSGFPGIKAGREIRNYPDSEFQRCLGTLNDRSLWEAFLRAGGLANNPKAVEAVESLIERIQHVTTAQIEQDSLKLLELSIKLLLSQINYVDAGSVSQERVQHLKESVQKIGWQVAAASAAVSASTAAGGSDLTPRIILAGLSGSAAVTVIGTIQSWHSQAQRSTASAPALLHQLHDDMIEQVDVLVAFISKQNDLAKEAAKDNSLLRFSLLRARFTVMYARQLWAGPGQFSHITEYQSCLTALAELLNALDQCIKNQAYQELLEIERDISAVRMILTVYGPSFTALQ